ncbi:hypothetical protein SAMN05443637_13041 [Pseudonocardia thermophila]|uniref:Uncharacterized protein n=1 Tax=Pseudonocardia thermophila TaxID=1848 RepID=A0A1M7AW56_PSETH|nr:hypothetical protein [Pseudonocardia thermophila]SHL46980.1 hypothetical protein SAMN05443637_13041 [Pseudonocardia thermophila]
MTTPTAELDRATVDLIFALRDSLTDDGPSRMDFWSGGRAAAAIATAAAGAESAAQAITTAARKLQIPQIATRHAATVRRVADVIDSDYQAWGGSQLGGPCHGRIHRACGRAPDAR